MKLKDLTGQRFGWLTVIDRNYTYAEEQGLKKKETFWNCRCDCGNIKVARAQTLTANSVRSCGCMFSVKEDLTGQKFGQLTVLRPDFETNKKPPSERPRGCSWLCECDCGNITSYTTNRLHFDENPRCEECKRHPCEDITGQKFNFLTAIERDYEYNKINNVKGVYWKCLCDCGNFTTVRVDALKKDNIKSCGCMRKELIRDKNVIDITNQRFGKLVVIRPVYDYAKIQGIKNSGNIVYWECKCDCGNICVEPGTELRKGGIENCPECAVASNGERRIKNLLDQYNINYINDKKYFNDLVSPKNNILRYDFIILNEDSQPVYLIEFDGEQHFKPIARWGGEERFQRQQEHDKIKNEYAFSHNLPLIRIPYTHYDKLCIEDLILDTSNFILKKGSLS